VPSYDWSYYPPAPVAEVILAHPLTGVSTPTLRGKLDTGADLTVIPRRLILDLGLSPKANVRVRGYAGHYNSQAIYYVRLSIEGHVIPGIRCLATDREIVLVGRNVLNRFVITLDGERLAFSMRPAAV
jgi:predicted aspartyl protease